jgi:hypothetical protein
MRKLVAVVIPALLITAATASAQQRKTGARTARTSAVWAVNHEVANNAPAPVAIQPAPAPAATIAAPVAHQGGCGPGCGGKCGHKHGDKCCKFLDWFCYRRSASCAKGCGCCYYCSPPLYSYFGCDCREGQKHGTVEPKPCPPSCSSCGWLKGWSAGHQMFASPSGHGACGVR